MKRGLFITFEGPDGSGKSTQIKKLKKKLENKGLETVLTREPGGTAISENIREIILDVKNSEMDSLTEALLYAAARSQHVTQVILPALEANKTVICDRFMDSSIAYQGYGRKLGDQVRIINKFAVRGITPDITFLLLLEPSIGKGRIKREYDRLELEQNKFHEDVYQGYMELAKHNPDRIIIIDATSSIIAIKKDADSMTLKAQNRLLKTLEEPQAGTVIMLLSNNIQNLTQTILSRCVILRINPKNSNGEKQKFEIEEEIVQMLLENEPFYKIKSRMNGTLKDKEASMKFLDGMERVYRDISILNMENSRLYKRSDINKIVSHIEEARRDLQIGVNTAYSLKNMILKIGG